MSRPSKADLLKREQRKAAAAKQDAPLWPLMHSPLMYFETERQRAQVRRKSRNSACAASPAIGPEPALWHLPSGDRDLSPAVRVEIPEPAPWAADMLRNMLQNMQSKKAKAHMFLEMVDLTKSYLYARGMTMVEAEQEIAKARGWKVETLHRMLTRYRKRAK